MYIITNNFSIKNENESNGEERRKQMKALENENLI